MKIKTVLIPALLLATVGLTACDNQDARVASRNLSTAADNFELDRRIVFYNGITGTYVLTIEGKCSFSVPSDRKVDVTCKVSPTEYKKHSLGISDNVTYFSEQLTGKGVSVYHYKVNFKPESIIPDIDLKTSLNKNEE